MSMTDFRRIIDTPAGGAIAVECTDGHTARVSILYTEGDETLGLPELDALIDALMRARAVITPKILDGNLDRRPN